MSGGRLVVVGDAVLDCELAGRAERLCPEAPVPVVDEPMASARPGGAGLAAVLAAEDGREVTLVTALGADEPGLELARLLADAGVETIDLGLRGRTPEKVRIRADGRLLLRVDRGGPPGRVGEASRRALLALSSPAALLVADYGRGVAAQPAVRAEIGKVARRRPAVWDPHPRGAQPLPGMRLVTPNGAEAAGFAPGVSRDGLGGVAERARLLAVRWQATGVAVTLGSRGAVLAAGDEPPLVVPVRAVPDADPCGAGDRFASAAAGLLADGALLGEAVEGAVRAASGFVAAGGIASTQARRAAASESPEPAEEVVANVRARGGTVVATGGCFDLLHAGHVAMLEASRALGDCLVVCLNSDESVRRLKGEDRPLVPEEDRAAVLAALGCVDAVEVFDEDTPAEVLERLRPDVFTKGADYAVSDLPEAEVVARWGGTAVVLPYVAGRSTTRLIEEAACRAVR